MQSFHLLLYSTKKKIQNTFNRFFIRSNIEDIIPMNILYIFRPASTVCELIRDDRIASHEDVSEHRRYVLQHQQEQLSGIPVVVIIFLQDIIEHLSGKNLVSTNENIYQVFIFRHKIFHTICRLSSHCTSNLE